MKRVLLLEDDQERIDWFVGEFEKYNFTYDWTDSAETAKKLVHDNKYHMIFLDHDLGGKQMVPSKDPNTGYQVAKDIPKTVNRDSRIIIHSWNPVGAQKMFEVLKKTKCPKVVKVAFGCFSINPY